MIGVNAMNSARPNDGAARVVASGTDPGGLNLASGQQRLLHGLRYMWESGVLCDAHLETEDGQRCGVHKVVLSAMSDYFRAMFTRGMQEAGTHAAICLRGIRGPILATLVNYLYTGMIDLTENNIVEITNAAIYLQFEDLLPHCFQFALTVLTAQNCFEMHHIAQTHKDQLGLRELALHLERSAFQCICDNVGEILISGNYTNMDFETVMQCVTLPETSDNGGMYFGPEIELFRHVIEWCKANKDSRPLTRIHYTVMSLMELELVDNAIQAAGFQNNDIGDAQRYLSLPMHRQVDECFERKDNPRYHIRNHPCIVTLAHRGMHKDMRFFILSPVNCHSSSKTLTWRSIPQMNESLPEEIALYFRPQSWVAVRGFLIILGQMMNNNLRCWIFNPRSLQWSMMAPMNVARTQCPLVECDGNLFVLGGVEYDGLKTSAVIEQYSFATGSWTVSGQMGVPLQGHGACSIDGTIYIYGGWRDSGRISSSIYTYNPSTETFMTHESPDLPCSLKLHIMLARIYGAIPYGMSHCKFRTDRADQWEPTTQANFAVPLAESVYFIGGSNERGSNTHTHLRRKKSVLKSRNMNSCVQVKVGGKQEECGCIVPQPDYPKGWQPSLTVGLSLPFDLVQYGVHEL